MTLTGINIPVRIGNVTVMPGDLVVGDKEGVFSFRRNGVTGSSIRADTLHVHDEWTRKKFDEGKYKSSEIYSSPSDPALKKDIRSTSRSGWRKFGSNNALTVARHRRIGLALSMPQGGTGS